MISWEAMLNATSYSIPNGGLPAMIWMYVVSLFGMGAAIVSMAEMASMAPTSGGQYHWVSEFAPKKLQKVLSYIIGMFTSADHFTEFELTTNIQVGFVSWVGKQV
jgi:choline transport protein